MGEPIEPGKRPEPGLVKIGGNEYGSTGGEKYRSWITGGSIAGESIPGIRPTSIPSSTISSEASTLKAFSFGPITFSVEASLAAGDTSPPVQKSSEETPVSRWTVAINSETATFMILGEIA